MSLWRKLSCSPESGVKVGGDLATIFRKKGRKVVAAVDHHVFGIVEDVCRRQERINGNEHHKLLIYTHILVIISRKKKGSLLETRLCL